MTKSKHAQYSQLAKWLHWSMASLIIGQYVLIKLAEQAEHYNQIVKQLGLIANHKSLGITILLLAVVRLIYRIKHTPPELPSTMPTWQIVVSNATHCLLYFFLFMLPISGWMMSSANAYSVSWFNLIALPDFIGPDEQNAYWLKLIHEWLATALAAIAFLHILAALKHHIIDKDNVLRKMFSRSSVAAAVLILFVIILAFSGSEREKKSSTLDDSAKQSSLSNTTNNEELNGTQADSNLAVWDIDYANSYIKFTGEQAGAPFTGEWQQWNAQLQFDKTQLQQSIFNVQIDINSVNSNDDQRDETILSSDFFNVLDFSEARFYSTDFSNVELPEKLSITSQNEPLSDANDSGQINSKYLAKGYLTIKGIKKPIDFYFQITEREQTIELTGTAELNRHSWQLGIGDWSDPTWVGSKVQVDVMVTAKK